MDALDLFSKKTEELVETIEFLTDQNRAYQSRIEVLEEQLRSLQRHRFGKRSESHRDDGFFQTTLFNEAEEILVEQEQTPPPDTIDIPAHKRSQRRARRLPDSLQRVDVVYDLSDDEKHCDCGKELNHIGHETLEQLSVVPAQYYVIRHIRKKYACSCKKTIKTAAMPIQPLPKSQASAQIIAYTEVAKYDDGLPLARQEKISLRNGVSLPRQVTARWIIDSSKLYQPLFNLIQDTFFSYDIGHSDETNIQVLKEPGKKAETKSFLWIRSGGPPGKPVILLDYSPTRLGSVASSLLDDFHGYLVCDAYAGYNAIIEKNNLKFVACNDHARRRFDAIVKNIGKTNNHKAWIAIKAIRFYKVLYKIERDIKDLPPEEKYAIRQKESVPQWAAFKDWLTRVRDGGVLHAATRDAIQYMFNHWDALIRYCEDGRLPISNIRSEHVAKAVAIARKNFLFSDSVAGAKASAIVFSMIATAKANGHHPHRYLSVILTELPNMTTVEEMESLLPWNITPEEVKRRFDTYPKP